MFLSPQFQVVSETGKSVVILVNSKSRLPPSATSFATAAGLGETGMECDWSSASVGSGRRDSHSSFASGDAKPITDVEGGMPKETKSGTSKSGEP